MFKEGYNTIWAKLFDCSFFAMWFKQISNSTFTTDKNKQNIIEFQNTEGKLTKTDARDGL
jgi:hypothetical protein